MLESIKNFLCKLDLKSIISNLDTIIEKLKALNNDGMKWVGTDGLINLESSALIMILLNALFPLFWAVLFCFAIICAKSSMDKSKGSTDEKHDIICCAIGVILGIILSTL